VICHRNERRQLGERQFLGTVEVDDLEAEPPEGDSHDVEGRRLGVVVWIQPEPPVAGRGFLCGDRNRPEATSSPRSPLLRAGVGIRG
jgi:hypothetical protein